MASLWDHGVTVNFVQSKKEKKSDYIFLYASHSALLNLPKRTLFICICLLFVSDPACFSNGCILKGNSLPRSWLCATVTPLSMQSLIIHQFLHYKAAVIFPFSPNFPSPPPPPDRRSCSHSGHCPQIIHLHSVMYYLFITQNMFPACNITDISVNISTSYQSGVSVGSLFF